MFTAFNPTEHAKLIAQGFEHKRWDVIIHNNGDCENGLKRVDHPAWDEYLSPTHRIVFNEFGMEVFSAERDLAFEDEMDAEMTKLEEQEHGFKP
jgi:hypothetical protein